MRAWIVKRYSRITVNTYNVCLRVAVCLKLNDCDKLNLYYIVFSPRLGTIEALASVRDQTRSRTDWTHRLLLESLNTITRDNNLSIFIWYWYIKLNL